MTLQGRTVEFLEELHLSDDEYSIEEMDNGIEVTIDTLRDFNAKSLVALANGLNYEVNLAEEPGLAGGEVIRLRVYEKKPGEVVLNADERDRLEVRLDHQPFPRTVRVIGREEGVKSPERRDDGEYTKVELGINGAAKFDAFINDNNLNRPLVWVDDVRIENMDDPYIETREIDVYERAGFMVHAREVET